LGIVASGVPSGVHRIYLHAVGRCEPPDFNSAGAASVGQPGQLAPPDLGRVAVGADGRIYMTTLAEGMKLRPSDLGSLPALLDADGASLVIHAGNQRIACAELR
jgi:Cu-Zn family superoxide dismutase